MTRRTDLNLGLQDDNSFDAIEVVAAHCIDYGTHTYSQEPKF
jgi:hypothetical protein